MKDARARKFDVVIVARFDRFARSVSHLLRALEEFSHLGVDFVSLSESIDNVDVESCYSWPSMLFGLMVKMSMLGYH
jgi:DNA invertase Pin-like site-specific DNA recombinase